ncbi:autorepressor SdpR family transcription factor [Priestia aryabhattai]|uniref:autorepressor SdpR family transcription factor n=1 Tax=Priestia aryabhattai TaxID=412384 RepID=UPI001CFCB5BB|nr:autorepressor SdpR family transcription factor [Priestia aryabhattai]
MNDKFKALADPTRRNILELLQKRDLTAGEISSHFALTKPSVSNHLKILKQAEFIRSTRYGQFIIYSINNSVFEDLIQWFLIFSKK